MSSWMWSLHPWGTDLRAGPSRPTLEGRRLSKSQHCLHTHAQAHAHTQTHTHTTMATGLCLHSSSERELTTSQAAC